uniref:Shugoshin C-terminal domain-containing protein n=1 Tax=Odontella aurita TaxID=265563 RepID=A0A7S4HRW1_9STRA|mmetsp:Transcript_1415/g.3904  ORF Transcript_1415/g.3904 Transcript_1415/m.3904 type:complete len:808 (+) Transcript_1415:231-2654(+)
MRKTGLSRNRSRRKTTQNGPGTPGTQQNDAPVPSPSTGVPATAKAPLSEQLRRKPTHEEAALTAKNYRLAKELSELRVRHRDETKAVTRLTMENMNLASRCREALSHVAMLKKELAMHQRRAAEALALQRQQSQRMSESGDEGAAAAMGRERVGSESSPPPPPPPLLTETLVEPSKHPPQTPQDKQHCFSDSNASDEQKTNATPKSKETGAVSVPDTNDQSNSRTLPVSQRPDFDTVSRDVGSVERKPAIMSSVSIKPGTFMDDIPADEMETDNNTSDLDRALDHFSGNSALPVTPEKEVVEDNSTSSFGNLEQNDRHSRLETIGKNGDPLEDTIPGFQTSAIRNDQKSSSAMSSIDAFEASFDTTFPVSFSSQSEEPPPSLDIAFDVPEFSDPFFLGSHDGGEGNASSPFVQPSPISAHSNKKGSFGQEMARDGDNLPGGAGETGIIRGKDSTLDVPIGVMENGGVASKLPSFDLFPSSAMSTFEQHLGSTPHKRGDQSSRTNQGFSGDSFFRTPPIYPDSYADATLQEMPPPPREKAGAAEARARYDAALGEKADQENHQQLTAGKSTTSVGTTKLESNHTPSLVLKRLQQRRAREKGSSSQSTPPAKSSSNGMEAKIENKKALRRSFDGDADNSTQRALSSNGDYGPKIRRNNSNSSSGGDISKGGRGVTSGKLSPDAMGKEMRQLDAIATASSSQLPEPSSALSTQPSDEALAGRRRNVKQPVSYAEPTLNKKLRRGDVYFPKTDTTSTLEPRTGEENSTIQVVSPTSGPELVDEIDLNPVQSTSAEEVLKDLAENTAKQLNI